MTIEIISQYEEQLHRLDKMILNLMTARQVEYAYERLQRLEVELTMDFMLEVETLTSSLVTAYGRLFTETDGVTKLRRTDVPAELRVVHDEIMDLRHQRHAHHGGHPSIQTDISLTIREEDVELKFETHLAMTFGAPRHWDDLIKWLHGYLHYQVTRQLDHLSSVSGKRWHWAAPPDMAGDVEAR